MTVRMGVNGFGRIGRNFLRAARSQGADLEFVAVNDLGSIDTMAFLLANDSVHGRLDYEVSPTEQGIVVDGVEVLVLSERNPADLPWGDLGVDVVVESTGIFRAPEQVAWHLEAGAKKVVLTVPPKAPLDNMVVLGVNDDTITPEQKTLSNASCTTNCLAPIAKILNDSFGIDHGIMTTVHALSLIHI